VTIIAIHQPEYLPWLGFFKKMMNSELFVLLDDVQFEKKSWQNRNRIRTKNGTVFLSVPIHAHLDSKLNDVKIDNTKNWADKHKKSILFNYTNTPYFDEYSNAIELIFEKKFEFLIELNYEIIKFVMKELEIKSKIIFSSKLKIPQKGSDKVLNICKAVDADYYITGTAWAKKYLKIEDFKKSNISVEFQELQHPIYKQIHKEFIPKMSIIDLLFNEGKNRAKQIIQNSIVTST
tara:strand:- start:187 stop:888 length:702 start_codon:yes stop_codon:yes gene_type:complete